ncbi:hypothetical protein ACFLWX_02270 [Chloroflexota bacterium]
MSTPSPTPTLKPTPTHSPSPTPDGNVEIEEILEEIAEGVATLRGLQPLETVEWDFMTGEELNAFM